MRFAEVFLRLGTSLVAWMILYAHVLWLAALHAMGCGPDGDELHRLLLGLAPFTCGFASLLRMTRPFAEIHRILRWLGAPLAALLPFALLSVWDVFTKAWIQSSSICGSEAPTLWQLSWAPAQLITLCVAAWMIVKDWRVSGLDTQNSGRQ
jgi:hypothetical protein